MLGRNDGVSSQRHSGLLTGLKDVVMGSPLDKSQPQSEDGGRLTQCRSLMQRCSDRMMGGSMPLGPPVLCPPRGPLVAPSKCVCCFCNFSCVDAHRLLGLHSPVRPARRWRTGYPRQRCRRRSQSGRRQRDTPEHIVPRRHRGSGDSEHDSILMEVEEMGSHVGRINWSTVVLGMLCLARRQHVTPKE